MLGLGDNAYSRGLPGREWDAKDAVDLLDDRFGDVYNATKYRTNRKGQKDPGWNAATFYVAPGNHDYGSRFRAGGPRIAQVESLAESRYGQHGRHRPIYRHVPFHHTYSSADGKTVESFLDSNDSAEYEAIVRAAGSGRLHELTQPEKLDLADNVLVVALDTQMIIQLYEENKNGRNEAAITAHWTKLDTILRESQAPWKILIGHHPIRSHGRHGGFRTRAELLLTGSRWYAPLPALGAVGTAVAAWRTDWRLPWLCMLPAWLLGLAEPHVLPLLETQDIKNSAYSRFRERLENTMGKRNVAVYCAGHDHSLQMLSIDGDPNISPYQIVSGSAGKTSPVTKKGDTLFAHDSLGYVRLDIRGDDMWVEFRSANAKTGDSASEGLFRIKKE
ncbi:hypothetical protein CMK11_12025 [Candidatus Poribacteria bacterium]|nr:hypothetical protein [Candidatus Poribacteria bacterium]